MIRQGGSCSSSEHPGDLCDPTSLAIRFDMNSLIYAFMHFFTHSFIHSFHSPLCSSIKVCT